MATTQSLQAQRQPVRCSVSLHSFQEILGAARFESATARSSTQGAQEWRYRPAVNTNQEDQQGPWHIQSLSGDRLQKALILPAGILYVLRHSSGAGQNRKLVGENQPFLAQFVKSSLRCGRFGDNDYQPSRR
jgi:hypothetical protein